MFGYNNIGKKLKGIGRFVEITIDLIALIASIYFFVRSAYAFGDFSVIFILIGIACLIFGPILAFLCVCLLYGFGELVDKVCDIERVVSGSGTAVQDVSAQPPVFQQIVDTTNGNTTRNYNGCPQRQDMNNQFSDPYPAAPVNNQAQTRYPAAPTNGHVVTPYQAAPSNNQPD